MDIVAEHSQEITQALVGDANGVDRIMAEALLDAEVPTTIHHMGARPRNIHKGAEYVPVNSKFGGRKYYEQKDIVMANQCDKHIGIVDTTKRKLNSMGTYKNHIRMVNQGKPSIIIDVNKGIIESNL